jgi:esterase
MLFILHSYFLIELNLQVEYLSDVYLDNFNYSILGQNTEQRIVFVHGLMAFSANWRKISNQFEVEYQCLIYDQRGHGRSFKPETGYTPQDLAEDLNKITNELGWDQFHLVGHSMGARVSMTFAHMYPEKVKSLCLEDSGADVSPNSFKYYEKMLNIVPTPFQNKEQVKVFFQNDFLKLFTPHEDPAVLMTFLQANIQETENGFYDWKFSKQGIVEIVRQGHMKDRWLEVSSFKMPVLLFRGENSHILSQAEYEKMLQVNPIIEGYVVKGAGHWLHYEKYQEFTDVLRQFLNSHR